MFISRTAFSDEFARRWLRFLIFGLVLRSVPLPLGRFGNLAAVAGFLIIAYAADRLASFASEFRWMSATALVLAAFSAVDLVAEVRAAMLRPMATGAGWIDTAVRPQTWPDVVAFVVVSVAGVVAVWSLYRGVARLAELGGRTGLARLSYRLAPVLTLAATAGFVYALVARWVTAPVRFDLYASLVALAVGGAGWVLLWSAQSELLDLPDEGGPRGGGGLPSGRQSPLFTGSVAAGLVVAVGYGVFVWWFAPAYTTPALVAIMERQPAELVEEPDHLVINRYENVIFGQAFNVPPDGTLGSAGGAQSLSEGESPLSCPAASNLLTGVNLVSGAVEWTWMVPVQPHFGVITVGDSVLVVDPLAEDVPVSVAAIDIDTGTLRWQRFLPTDVIVVESIGLDGERVGLTNPATWKQTSKDFFVVDADGELTDPTDDPPRMRPTTKLRLDELLERVVNGNVREAPIRASYAEVIAPVGATFGPSDPNLLLRKVEGRFGYGEVLHRYDPESGQVVATPTPFAVSLNGAADDIFGFRVDLEWPLQVGDGYTLVVWTLPREDSMTVTAVDGEAPHTYLWQRHDLKWAAAAGPNVALQTRADDGSAMVHLARSTDPDEYLWSVPVEANRDGANGYVGVSGEDLVFYVEPESRPSGPSGPAPAGRGRFLTLPNGPLITDPGKSAETIRAAGGPVGNSPWTTYADEKRAVVLDRNWLVWGDPNGPETGVHRLDLSGLGWHLPSLAVVGDMAIVTWDYTNGC